MKPTHLKVHIEGNSRELWVDYGVLPVLSHLWAAGVDTVWDSCQGGYILESQEEMDLQWGGFYVDEGGLIRSKAYITIREKDTLETITLLKKMGIEAVVSDYMDRPVKENMRHGSLDFHTMKDVVSYYAGESSVIVAWQPVMPNFHQYIQR